jgi:hypothetical protein
MKPYPLIPAVLFAFGVGMAFAAGARGQEPAPASSSARPPHDPKVEAALKACWSDLGGDPAHPVAPELIEQCMLDKGFAPPPGPPPGPGAPPAPASTGR